MSPISRVVSMALVLLLTAGPAMAQAARTRPGGGSSAAPRTQAGGRATYGYHGRSHSGHHRHGYGYHPYRYHYGYYGDYGYPYLFGWPYWGLGFGWGGWYPRPVYRASAPGEAPGALITRVQPKKARVAVDGQFVGKAKNFNGTWDRLWLEPGLYSLELSRKGYQTLRVNVDVHPGMTVKLEEQLREGAGLDPRSQEPPSVEARSARQRSRRRETRIEVPDASAPATLASGLLRLDVVPADAAIYLDGEFLAQAGELRRLHGAIPVATGRHRVEVVRPGYATVSRTVDVGEGTAATLSVVLEAE